MSRDLISELIQVARYKVNLYNHISVTSHEHSKADI